MRRFLRLIPAVVFMTVAQSSVTSGQVVRTDPDRPPVVVGANVRISESRPDLPHFEPAIAAHPTNPAYLIACSMVNTPLSPRYRYSTVVYSSADGGESWSLAMDEKRLESSADAMCTFGLDDTAYYVTLLQNTSYDFTDPRTGKSSEQESSTGIFRSSDAGRSWTGPIEVPFNDRETVLVDRSAESSFRGSVYISGHYGNATFLSFSRDGVRWEGPSVGDYFLSYPGSSALLSDGTLVIVGTGARERSPDALTSDRYENAEIAVTISVDGGVTLSDPVKVDDLVNENWPTDLNFTTGMLASIASDLSGGPYQDRLYVVWGDLRAGYPQMLLARSDDKGRSWASPIVINEPRPREAKEQTGDMMHPVVAVNQKGIVGVSYYSRRDNPDGLGYHVRFQASYDGGESWTPSVTVSTEAASFGELDESLPLTGVNWSSGEMQISVQGFAFVGGHYSGMAVDAEGRFRPGWVDNRTGVSQLWTAPVTVEGEAIKNGAPELAASDDITEKVTVQLLDPVYDGDARTITASLRLKNTSDADLHGPMKLRVVGLDSELGATVEVVGADNGKRGVGAVLDLAGILTEDILAPGAESLGRPVTFRVTGIQRFREGDEIRHGLLNVKVRVLGHLADSE